MSLPSLALLQKTEHPLIICARAWAKPLVEEFNPVQFVPMTGHLVSDIKALRKIEPTMRGRSFGLLMPDSMSSALVFKMSGVKSAGYVDDARGLLLQWPFRKPNGVTHAVNKWWQLTQKALEQWALIPLPAISTEAPRVGLTLSAEDFDCAQKALLKVGLQGKRFVLLAPTATGTHNGKIKVWPHFRAFAKQLKAAGHHVLTCPPPNEREQAMATCPDATLLDPLPLKGFCALASEAALVVCNDSGVSHLAAAVNANQLTLFGVTDPANTGPWSDQANLLGAQNQWPSLDDVWRRSQQLLHKSASVVLD